MGKTVLFVEANNGTASCVTCNESVAVLQEDNLCRHYTVAQSRGIAKSSKIFNPNKIQTFEHVLN